MNILQSANAGDITPLTGVPGGLIFGTLIVFFDLLCTAFTVAQARAQHNRKWWIWGLLTLVVPLLGYTLWRIVGAKDDGSPGQLLPRR